MGARDADGLGLAQVSERGVKWFLLSNAYGGTRVLSGRGRVEVKRGYRSRIAESFYWEQGLSRSASDRAAQTYRVWVVSEHSTEAEAKEAEAEFDPSPWGFAHEYKDDCNPERNET